MKKHRRRSMGRVLTAILMLAAMLVPSGVVNTYAAETDADTGITVDKTADGLDDNLETNVSLSFPGKEDELGSDIVFVLDKSAYSAQAEIMQQAKEFLSNVKQQADEKGISVKVGVVIFNRIGNVQLELSDISTSYDQILDALDTRLSSGTNMHAGLLAGEKMLDDDTAVPDSRKHLVLITDGATYLYCKDGNYTTAYTRSFGDPKQQDTSYGGADRQGGIWEYQSRDYNVSYDGTGNVPLYTAMQSPEALGDYLDIRRQHEAEYTQYDYVFETDSSGSINLANRTSCEPISADAVCNIDEAYIKCDDTFQEIASKYHTYVYFKNTGDFDGSVFLEYITRNTGGISPDFAELEKQVVNLIDKGSCVDDVIGSDFDFVDDASRISLQVGDTVLPAVSAGNGSYTFGDQMEDGNYPYVLTYTKAEDGTETLHLAVNTAVSASAPLKLTYAEKLVNVPDQPGDYTFNTNNNAVLHCVDSNGNAVADITFPVPAVTYTVAESTVQPVTIDPPAVQKVLTGDTPAETAVFTFDLTAKPEKSTLPDGMTALPMPESAGGGDTARAMVNGAGETEFGTITFQQPGTYVYEVTEENAGLNGYTYDGTVYTLTFNVTQDDDGNLSAICTSAKDGTAWADEKLVFTNQYEGQDETSGTVSSAKTGDTGMPALWTILMIGGGAVLLAAVFGRMRRRN